MANCRPGRPIFLIFRPAGIRYSQRDALDLSRVIAPPYDVPDSAGKAAMQVRYHNKVVTIDLLHMPPPKSAGLPTNTLGSPAIGETACQSHGG